MNRREFLKAVGATVAAFVVGKLPKMPRQNDGLWRCGDLVTCADDGTATLAKPGDMILGQVDYVTSDGMVAEVSWWR